MIALGRNADDMIPSARPVDSVKHGIPGGDNHDRGGNMMNATTMATLRESLMQRRDEIQRELARLADELQTLGTDQDNEGGARGNHPGDDGSNMAEAARIATLSGDFREIANHIEAALARMDDGAYGACQRCGNPINEERLEAFPYVPYCIACQTQLERDQALRTGH
jgi:DnaK suppressor protein